MRSGFKPEETGYSRQPVMYKLPLIHKVVFLCIPSLIVLNAVPIHWFPISWPKNLPSPVVTKIAMNVILWFLKKEKLNFCFSGVTRKFAPCLSERTVIGKMCFPNNHVEICFFNLRPVFMFAWTKQALLNIVNWTWWYWFISFLFLVIFHHRKQIDPNGFTNCHNQ